MMKTAARAIIIEDGKLLVIRRDKENSQYFTLPGGVIANNETAEEAVRREIHEETGLRITSARLVFIEKHPEPYNEQHIFLCATAPHGEVAIQAASEEDMLNKLGFNSHTPVWIPTALLPRLPFLTPHLGEMITKALKSGFPMQPATI